MAGKAATKTKARTLAVVEVDRDEETGEAADETKGIPLFEGLQGEVQIEVYRLEPIEEGTIGTLAADADEATIRRRWGGGVYKVTAKGTNGQFTRRQRTVTIGGDPRFESKDAIRRYRIKNGEIQEEGKSAAAPAAAAPSGFGMSEILALLQTSHTQQLAFMQAQVNASSLAADQRAQAAAKMAEDARARDQQFLASMLALRSSEAKAAPPAADPMAMMTVLLKGLELGRDMGGGGEADPVTAFISALPQILPQAQALLNAGKEGAAAAPAAVAAPANQQQPAGPRLLLTGPIAERFQRTVAALQAKGYDAEKALAVALEQLAAVPNAPTKASPTPEGKAAAPAPAAAAGNGTTPPARATRRK